MDPDNAEELEKLGYLIAETFVDECNRQAGGAMLQALKMDADAEPETLTMTA